jgi:hypothetical protein
MKRKPKAQPQSRIITKEDATDVAFMVQDGIDPKAVDAAIKSTRNRENETMQYQNVEVQSVVEEPRPVYSVKQGSTIKAISLATGAPIQALVVEKRVKDRDFNKLFLGEMLARLAGLDELGVERSDLPLKSVSSALDRLLQLVNLANADNVIIADQKALSKLWRCSVPTVSRYLQVFQLIGLIKPQLRSVYMLDPDIFAMVGKAERVALVSIFNRIPDHKEDGGKAQSGTVVDLEEEQQRSLGLDEPEEPEEPKQPVNGVHIPF